MLVPEFFQRSSDYSQKASERFDDDEEEEEDDNDDDVDVVDDDYDDDDDDEEEEEDEDDDNDDDLMMMMRRRRRMTMMIWRWWFDDDDDDGDDDGDDDDDDDDITIPFFLQYHFSRRRRRSININHFLRQLPAVSIHLLLTSSPQVGPGADWSLAMARREMKSKVPSGSIGTSGCWGIGAGERQERIPSSPRWIVGIGRYR